jgi:transposase
MPGMRRTYKEKLRPTPEQEQGLDVVLWRCRTLYNVALEQHKTAWERCHVSVKRSGPSGRTARIVAKI